MDFIEQLFGLSPDNGDGSTEILWLSVLAILFMTAVWWKRSGYAAPFGFARRGLPRFTCAARTRVGDQEAVVVVAEQQVANPNALIGASILIDGVRYVVVRLPRTDVPVAPGRPIMMRVRIASLELSQTQSVAISQAFRRLAGASLRMITRKRLAAAALAAAVACASLPLWTALGEYSILGVVALAILGVVLWASGM